MKKTIFLLSITALLLCPGAYSKNFSNSRNRNAVEGSVADQAVSLTALDGAIGLSMTQGDDFPCIGIHLSDKNINRGMGTYLEIKRLDNRYVVKIQYEIRQFRTIDKAIQAYLKDLFSRFYRDMDPVYAKQVWSKFVKEGGVKKFIDTAKGWIDDEFLDSPFNEIYG